jgi:hypothetical protein
MSDDEISTCGIDYTRSVHLIDNLLLDLVFHGPWPRCTPGPPVRISATIIRGQVAAGPIHNFVHNSIEEPPEAKPPVKKPRRPRADRESKED